ncbi:MAG: sensor histidine kinase [Acutalibacter sp.]|jgi:two-component system sensor histidine kinase YesM
MKIKQPFSVKKYIRLVFLAIILVFAIVSLIYSGLMSYYSAKSTLSEFNVSIQNYMDNLSSALRVQSEFNRTIVSSDPNFALLATDGASEVKRLPLLYNLRQIIYYHNNQYCVTMFCDSKKDDVYYSPTLFPSKDLQAYRIAYHQIANEAYEGSSAFGQWFHKKVVDEDYLIFQKKKDRMTLCTMFSLEKYTSQYPIPSLTDNSIVSIFSSDKIISSQEALEDCGIGLTDLQDGVNSSNLVLRSGNLVLSYYIEECKIGISVVTPVSEFVSLASERFFVAAVFLALTVLMFAAFYTISNRMLLMPVIEISEFSKQIEKTHDYSISKPSRIQEVQETQEALVSLAKTISELETVRRAEEEEKSHALLQYYQLQTRSHFFINCLKSLYSMVENRQIDKMKLMILAFSNHLRYLFHDNISTVPLSFELQEIEDYYQILSLDSGKIFLLDVDVEQGLEEYSVPPLIIQSFLENSFKYNDGKNGMVFFSVKVSATKENGNAFLRIRMQDNGKGYPKDVLEAINKRVKYSFEENHVGINNLKHRLSILYGDQYSFAFYNLPAGGACSMISIPLQRKEENA